MRKTIIQFLVLILAGCAGTQRSSDPFFGFEPIYTAAFSSPEKALIKVIEVMESEGYSVAPNMVFLTVFTEPKDIGYQVWRTTNEKWKVSYQVGVQIIKPRGRDMYWKIFHHIVGKRSGTQDRNFNPEDFEETFKILNNLTIRLMKLFSSGA
jgi:hypothetical protein